MLKKILFNFKKSNPVLKLKDYYKYHIKSDNTEWLYLQNNTIIAHVCFRTDNGQIGLIDVNKSFRRNTLAIQIIKEVENELKKNKINIMWVSCTKGHYFWSNIKGFHFKEDIHPSVNSCGYYHEIIE